MCVCVCSNVADPSPPTSTRAQGQQAARLRMPPTSTPDNKPTGARQGVQEVLRIDEERSDSFSSIMGTMDVTSSPAPQPRPIPPFATQATQKKPSPPSQQQQQRPQQPSVATMRSQSMQPARLQLADDDVLSLGSDSDSMTGFTPPGTRRAAAPPAGEREI